MSLICYIYYLDAVDHVFRLITRLQGKFQISDVLVIYHRSNIGAPVPSPSSANFRFFPYDGTDWEFGAYQMGLNLLSPDDVEGVLVLNDTAGRNYPLFEDNVRELARLSNESALAQHPVLIGRLESQGLNFEIQGLAFSSWIRSNIFYINRAGLNALDRRLFDPTVFSASTCRNGVVSTGGITSTNLEVHTANWLGTSSGKHGWLAHAGKAEVPDGVLASKAGSILLEKYLSARISAAGGRLLSYDAPLESRLAWLRIKGFYLKRRISRMLN